MGGDYKSDMTDYLEHLHISSVEKEFRKRMAEYNDGNESADSVSAPPSHHSVDVKERISLVVLKSTFHIPCLLFRIMMNGSFLNIAKAGIKSCKKIWRKNDKN